MPADRKSTPRRRAARSAEPSSPASPSAPPPAPAPAPAPASASAEDESTPVPDGTAEEHVPLNRAERRGHGKRASSSQVPDRGKVTRRSSSVQGPRMWSNRRGGA